MWDRRVNWNEKIVQFNGIEYQLMDGFALAITPFVDNNLGILLSEQVQLPLLTPLHPKMNAIKHIAVPYYPNSFQYLLLTDCNVMHVTNDGKSLNAFVVIDPNTSFMLNELISDSSTVPCYQTIKTWISKSVTYEPKQVVNCFDDAMKVVKDLT